MGFDINFNKPIIKEAQAMQDGGAGNLGYFEREEENKKKKNTPQSIFTDAEGSDSFQKHDENAENIEDFSISKLIAQIILAVKDFFKKLIGQK